MVVGMKIVIGSIVLRRHIGPTHTIGIAVIVVASAREMELHRQRDAVVAAENAIGTREGFHLKLVI